MSAAQSELLAAARRTADGHKAEIRSLQRALTKAAAELGHAEQAVRELGLQIDRLKAENTALKAKLKSEGIAL